MFFNGAGDVRKNRCRWGSCGWCPARSRPVRPAVDAHPVHLLDFAVDQTLEAVADAQHDVAAVQTDAHRGAHGRVHPRRRRAGMHHRQPAAFLSGLGGCGRARSMVFRVSKAS